MISCKFFYIIVLFVFISASTLCFAQNIQENLRKVSDDAKFEMGSNPVGPLPHYHWYYGCSPTSAAMVVGYWDAKAGYGNLIAGNASIQSQSTKDVIAGKRHINAGVEKGYVYGTYQNTASDPIHEAEPDCLADFMKTVNSGTYPSNMASGIENYISWDNPETAINESYNADADLHLDSYWHGDFTYDLLKTEIDADRPLILNVLTYNQAKSSWLGHSVVCYGYRDDGFNIFNPGIGSNVSVAAVAVDDTWDNGTDYAQWLFDSDGDSIGDMVIEPEIDDQGTEWWPLIGFGQTNGYGFANYMDWTLHSVVTLNVEVPEPTGILLLSVAGMFLRNRS